MVRAKLGLIAPWARLYQRENQLQAERITADSAVQVLVSVKRGYRTPAGKSDLIWSLASELHQMTIAESKDAFALKDTVLMVPVFATSVAISWEVGKFSVTGGFFFFSLSEHLISAISALPIAMGVALLTLSVLAVIKKGAEESTAPWTKKQKARMVFLVFLLAIACAVVGAWTNSLFLLFLGTIAALMASIFGTLAIGRSDTLGVLSFVVMGALLPYAAASDFTKRSLDSPNETQSTIKLKSGSLYGVIIMAGEKGILVFKRDTRTFLFLRADEVLNIEYMMPEPPLLFN